MRSLADVFTDQAWMVQYYAAYVLHQEALQLANPTVAQQAKKIKDKDVLKEQKRLAKLIMVRPELRADKV